MTPSGFLRFFFLVLVLSPYLGVVPPCSAQSELAAETAVDKVEKAPPGPWGNLEYFTLVIEPPSDYVERSPSWNAHLRPTQWTFSNTPAAEIQAVLMAAGLSELEAAELTAKSSTDPLKRDVTVFPTEQQVISLKPEARERLYGFLANENRDDPFSHPYSFNHTGFRNLAADSGLPKEVVDLVDSLTYPRFEARLFSDVDTALRRMPDEAGRRQLLSTLHRTASLAPRLRLDASSDLRGIAEYWSAFGRSKDILPMLESVAYNSGSPSIDLVHLLPATPRKLLHTYPRALMSLGAQFPDCYWSAFNFFSSEPSDRYLDNSKMGSWLADQYDRIESPGAVGDLILYFDKAAGEPVHACSFVAGDIVFTKNGLSMMKPWVLQTIEEVNKTYLTSADIEIRHYRQRRQP